MVRGSTLLWTPEASYALVAYGSLSMRAHTRRPSAGVSHRFRLLQGGGAEGCAIVYLTTFWTVDGARPKCLPMARDHVHSAGSLV